MFSNDRIDNVLRYFLIANFLPVLIENFKEKKRNVVVVDSNVKRHTAMNDENETDDDYDDYKPHRKYTHHMQSRIHELEYIITKYLFQ